MRTSAFNRIEAAIEHDFLDRKVRKGRKSPRVLTAPMAKFPDLLRRVESACEVTRLNTASLIRIGLTKVCIEVEADGCLTVRAAYAVKKGGAK